MFGYVLADKPSMRIREYEYYRSTYCGLCHSMGKCTGCLSCLTLSYDMTFLVLLRESIEGTQVEIEKKRCVRHPLHAVNTVKMNDQLEFCACAGGILTFQKLADDVSDERGARRFLASAARLVLSGAYKKSVDALPELDEAISDGLGRLSKVEADEVASIDIPADIFGDIMAAILSHGIEGERHIVARSVGKRIGRWIYIADALDDYNKDKKSGSYNPFVLLYGGEEFTPDNILSISSMLEAELSMALDALDLLDADEDRNRSEIIKNILCLGMPGSVKRICDGLNKDIRNGDNK